MPALNLLLISLAATLTLLAWTGWGSALAFLLKLPLPSKALRCTLGMALNIALGGIACALSIATTPLLLTLLALGLLFLALTPSIQRLPRPSPWLAAILAFTLFQAAQGILSTDTDRDDDRQAYNVFPKQIEQSGTLLAPLTMRRYATYGGYAFLQAETRSLCTLAGGASLADFLSLHALTLDAGLMTLLAAALLWHLLGPRTTADGQRTALLIALYLLTPIPRVSSHAQQTATVLLLALAALLRHIRRADAPGLACALLAGLLATAIATTRINFLGMVVITLVLPLLTFPRRVHLTARVKVGLAFFLPFLTLLPWALVLLKSSGTPLYPFIKPDQVSEFLYVGLPLSLRAHILWLTSNFLSPATFLLLLPLLLAFRLGLKRDALPLYGGAIAATAFTFWLFTVDPAHTFRYCEPMLKAAFWTTLALACRGWRRYPPWIRAGILLMALALPGVEALRFSVPPASQCVVLILFAWAIFAAARRRAAPWTISAFLLLASLWFVTHPQVNTLFFFGIAVASLGVRALAARKTPDAHFHRLLFVASLLLLALCTGYVLGAMTTLLWTGIAIASGFTFHAPRQPPSFQRTLCLALGPLTVVMLLLIDNGSPFDHAGPWLLAGALALLFLFPPPSFPSLPATVFAAALTLLFFASAVRPQWPYLLSPWTIPVWCAIVLFPLLRFQAPRVFHAMTSLLLVAAMILAIPVLPEFTAIAHDQSRAALQLHRTLAASAAAQAAIPAGAPVVVCVEYPMAFDFHRNPLVVSDWPIAFFGRTPPIPLDGPTSPMLDYLRHRGYRYALITPPDAPSPQPESLLLRDALVRAVPPARWRYHADNLAVLDLSDETTASPDTQARK